MKSDLLWKTFLHILHLHFVSFFTEGLVFSSENVGSQIFLYNFRIVNLRIPCVRFPPYIMYGTWRLIFSQLGQMLKNKAKVTLHPLSLVLSNSDSLSFANKSMLILATPSALPHNHFTLTDIKTIATNQPTTQNNLKQLLLGLYYYR